MTELPFLDALGWLGFAGLMIFYWMIGNGRPMVAYLASCFGAAMFLVVGLATQFGYGAKLPSLWVMETCIILLNIRSMWRLRKENQTGILARLPEEQQERIARNAAAARERMAERGEYLTEVDDIRRRKHR